MQTLNMDLEIIHQQKLYLSLSKIFWKTWIGVKTQTFFFDLGKAFDTIDHRTFLCKELYFSTSGKLNYFWIIFD